MNKTMTFEKAMKKLEEIVQELEAGELTLEESFKKFQEGVKLSKYCSSKLDETENKITLLLKNHHGDLTETPFVENDEGN
jgi:exodeoxyribonuclease VII small subunit